MRTVPKLCLSLLAAATFASTGVCSAAAVDARPPDRLTFMGSGVRLPDSDDNGGGASLNYLHYFTPDLVVGLGAEHQTIVDSQWTFGSVRGSS